MATVSMYGPAFDDEKKTVNREVPAEDVPAFEAHGYKKGKDKDAETVEAGQGGKKVKDTKKDKE